MGRPPTNGGPAFRFNPVEVGEMEAILHAYKCAVPGREILEALAQRFSSSAERAGKVEVSVKQVLNWFQNRRYALRAKAARSAVPGQLNMSPVPNQAVANTVAQAPQLQTAASTPVRGVPQVPQSVPAPPAAQSAGRNASENSQMEFEAKSARDGAWYDIACFLSYRSLESGNPEALVRLAGFGEEEDEWVNIRRNVRQRSLPCESSECVAVLPGDLVLCFQEGKDQALYFDAHVLDAQRRRHDIRGCRCRFLVRYDHDQSEEIVPLRKICRRPETDYRLQQLYARSANANPQKTSTDPHAGNLPAAVGVTGGTMQNLPTPEDCIATGPMTVATTQTNVAAAATTATMTNATTLTSVAAAATTGSMANATTPTGVAAAATTGSMTNAATQTNVAAAVTTSPMSNAATQTNVGVAVTTRPMTNVAAPATTGSITIATTQPNVAATATTGSMTVDSTQTNAPAAATEAQSLLSNNIDSGNGSAVAVGNKNPSHAPTMVSNTEIGGDSHPSLLQQQGS